MGRIVDLVQQYTATTGTGPLTLGAAVPGFRTIAAAGIPDGTEVSYAIQDGTNRETDVGLVGGSGTTLTRGLRASSTGSLLNLTGNAVVGIAANAGDFELSARTSNSILNNYYYPHLAGVETATPVADRLYVFPFFFPLGFDFNRLGFVVGGTHSSSINVRVGIWNDRNTNASIGPGTLIFDSGTIATTGADVVHEATCSVNLSGLKWGGLIASGTTASLRAADYQQGLGAQFNQFFGITSPYGFSQQSIYRSVAFGALGNETSNTFTVSGGLAPCPFLRRV